MFQICCPDCIPYEVSNNDQKNVRYQHSAKYLEVDVTFQNLDSSEISLTDVSHYFDNDPTKVVGNLRKDGKKPASLIADTTTANAQVRSLSAQVRLDSRTKLLNPKFYEANLNAPPPMPWTILSMRTATRPTSRTMRSRTGCSKRTLMPSETWCRLSWKPTPRATGTLMRRTCRSCGTFTRSAKTASREWTLLRRLQSVRPGPPDVRYFAG
eukprot:s1226_g19.t1